MTAVLVVSPDRRFLRVTEFLLRRRGLVATTSERREDAMRTLARTPTDAVVVDAEGSPAEAAAWTRALKVLHPAVAVVVAVEPASASSGATLVSKWSPVEELANAIEVALCKTS